jgi:hypothetical protein
MGGNWCYVISKTTPRKQSGKTIWTYYRKKKRCPPPKKKKFASLNGRRRRKIGRSKYKNNSKTHCTSIMEGGSLESEKWDNRLP